LNACCNTLAGRLLFTPNNHMKRFSSVLVLALGLTLVGAGCGLTTTVNVNEPVNTNVSLNVNVAVSGSITYAGQDGKNALELLQQKNSVDVSAQGFVNAINGRKPGEREFWAFYVNGKQAEVGAKDYATKTSDAIEWKLETF